MYELVLEMYSFGQISIVNFNVSKTKFNTHAKYSRQFSMGVTVLIMFCLLCLKATRTLFFLWFRESGASPFFLHGTKAILFPFPILNKSICRQLFDLLYFHRLLLHRTCKIIINRRWSRSTLQSRMICSRISSTYNSSKMYKLHE
jgi:hypothetical protein